MIGRYCAVNCVDKNLIALVKECAKYEIDAEASQVSDLGMANNLRDK